MFGIKTFLLIALASSTVLAQKGNEHLVQAAAAAPAPGGSDCNCQCVTLQYRDSIGKLHGNCASTIQGAQWCYVEYDGHSPCPDLRRSQRFRGKYWSNHACATPSRNSPVCRYVFPLQYETASAVSSGSFVRDNDH